MAPDKPPANPLQSLVLYASICSDLRPYRISKTLHTTIFTMITFLICYFFNLNIFAYKKNKNSSEKKLQ